MSAADGVLMRSDGIAIPRLRFDTMMAEDESIPGALMKATASHVLWQPGLVINAAGVRCPYPGDAQLLPKPDLVRLAFAMRCDADALAAHGGVRLHSSTTGQTHQRIKFGDLILPRALLELRTRRIGPRSLAVASHHRLDWLNKLLPYCPTSLERLVDRCTLCCAPLRWMRTWGVAVCETCEQTIPPSGEAPLAAELEAPYRIFAKMVSPLAEYRAEARADLHEQLRSTSDAVLFRLVWRLGLLFQDTPVTGFSETTIDHLPTETLVAVVTTGTRMLIDWPQAVVNGVQRRADDLRGDPEGFLDWKTLLRRLVGTTQPPEQRDLLLSILPELQGARLSRSFGGGRRFYLLFEAAKLLGLDYSLVADAVVAGAIPALEIPGRRRRRYQIDADAIDALAARMRHSPSVGFLVNRTKIPTYGVLSLVHAGLLVEETDPAIVAIRPWNCITEKSVEDLNRRLGAVAQTTAVPDDAIVLRSAVRRFGGRPKPWGAILSAIVDGLLPAWLARGQALDARSLLVRVADISRFDAITADEWQTSALPDTISQDDLGELLNTAPKYLPQVHADFGTTPFEQARAECIRMEEALEIARRLVTTAELGCHLNLHSRAAGTAMRHRGFDRLSIGWSRAQLIGAGILPDRTS